MRSLYTALAVPYTRTICSCIVLLCLNFLRCVYFVWILEHARTDVCMSECFECRRIYIYNVVGCLCVCWRWLRSSSTLKAERVDAYQLWFWIMTVLVLTNERANERASEWLSEQPNERMNKRALEKWRRTNTTTTTTTNELCSDERVNNPLNCVQHKRVFAVGIHTHTLAHRYKQSLSLWDMPILNSDFVTSTNMTNTSE